MNLITEDIINKNPNTLFIFGDNAKRVGTGGQAKVCRDKRNTFGVITKRLPSYIPTAFYTDSDEHLEELVGYWIQDSDLIAWNLQNFDHTYVIPGIGTGLADLPNKAPRANRILQKFLKEIPLQIAFEDLVK